MLASALILSGARTEAAALLDRFLPLFRVTDPLTEAGELLMLAAQCYFWLERHDTAAELLATLTSRARRGAAPTALVMPLSCRSELDLRTGRWPVAAAGLHEAAHLNDEMAQSVFAAYPLECLARLAAATGDEQGCRAHAARALALIDAHANELGRLYVLSALGLLELGLGNIRAAIDHLVRAQALADSHGLAEPNVVHWQADLIEAYVRAGEGDAARAALAAFEAQAHATAGRWARGAAARCRGLLASDAGEQDACFASAVEQLQRADAPFEVARTQLCWAERLRRAGRRTDARRALDEAITGLDHLGAAPWAQRARTELLATGATLQRRRDRSERDQLTPHELQVTLIVARRGEQPRGRRGPLPLTQDDRVPPRARLPQARGPDTLRARRARRRPRMARAQGAAGAVRSSQLGDAETAGDMAPTRSLQLDTLAPP